MEIQHVICYAFSVDKDYKILRIMEMGCIDMMNKYAELIPMFLKGITSS